MQVFKTKGKMPMLFITFESIFTKRKNDLIFINKVIYLLICTNIFYQSLYKNHLK